MTRFCCVFQYGIECYLDEENGGKSPYCLKLLGRLKCRATDDSLWLFCQMFRIASTSHLLNNIRCRFSMQ